MSKLTADEIAIIRQWIALQQDSGIKTQEPLKREKTEVRSQKTEWKDSQIRDLTASIEALERTNQELRTEASKDADRIKNLRATYESLDAKLRTLQATHNTDVLTIDGLKARNQELTDALYAQQNEVKKLASQRAQNDALIADLQKQLAAKPEKHSRADIARIKELEEEVRSQKSESENYPKRIEELGEALNTQRDEYESRIRALIEDANRNQREIAEHKAEIKSLQTRLSEFEGAQKLLWQQSQHMHTLITAAHRLNTVLASDLLANSDEHPRLSVERAHFTDVLDKIRREQPGGKP